MFNIDVEELDFASVGLVGFTPCNGRQTTQRGACNKGVKTGLPHFTDQAPLFAAHRTKPVHFTRTDIAAHAVRRYVVSNR